VVGIIRVQKLAGPFVVELEGSFQVGAYVCPADPAVTGDANRRESLPAGGVMVPKVVRFIFVAALCLLFASGAAAQTAPTGTLTGSVLDPTPAAVVGAQVHVVDDTTGKTYDTTSGADGAFSIGNLPAGTYTVTITKEGFKKAVYKNVKIVVNQTYDLNAKVEVGEIGTQIVVEAGQEVLETANTTVGTSIVGKAITSLPFTSRDALDLAVLMPGAQTTGRPRQTSFEGLPKGSINLTIDGINVQDTVLKSNDGFFTTIRPRVDDIEEFSISTAAQGASEASEGAVQIHFVSKRGGNTWHGGGWEYLRNDWFNANFYFSNQNNPQLPRQIFRLNEYGYKIGGPILKDKLFFFTDMDIYSNPQSQIKTRTVLTQAATQGLFNYAPVDANGNPCTVGASGCASTAPNAWTACSTTTNVCTANLIQNGLQAAAGASLPAPTLDTYTANVLGILNTVVPGANGIVDPGTPCSSVAVCNQRRVAFNVNGTGKRYFPDVRFDWNITKNHSFEFDYHYGSFNGNPDFLNGREMTFPVAPFNQQQGGQISNRNLFVGAWRWNLASNKSNELRLGIRSNPLAFFPNLTTSIYAPASTNLGNTLVRVGFTGLMTNPFQTYAPSGRNDAIGQLIDTFTWSKGTHSISFGLSWFELRYNGFSASSGPVHAVGLGLVSNDPLASPFNSGLANISATDLSNAGSLYATLIGRVTSYSGNVNFDPVSRTFKTGVPFMDRIHQREFGFYGQDSWHVRPSVTVTYGLRWEYQGAPWDVYNETFAVQGGLAGIYGISGFNNLFKPGTLAGSTPVYVLNGSNPWYNRDLKDFAPNLGVAWQPNFENSLLKKFFGGSGKTVLRAGYSISYTREGVNNWFSIAEGNPGYQGSRNETQIAPSSTCTSPTNCAAGNFPAGSIQASSMSFQNVLQSPSSFVSSFAITPSASQSVNAFDPNIKVPRVQSWSLGIQREITPSTVLEVRYVGNHSTGLWRQVDLNEVNIFENGFLQEFVNAQRNLAICRAQVAACRTALGVSSTSSVRSYANLGLTDPTLGPQVNVPVLTAAFTGSFTGPQLNSNFTNTTFISNLDNGGAGSFASSISGDLTRWTNIKTAGLPSNYFVVDPDARGGAFQFYNGSQSTYNALVVEFRRRPSKGLQFNGNYSFSKSLTNYFADSSVSFNSFTTIRNQGYNKGPAPFDLRHQLKVQGIYELPFGPGRKWSSGNWVAKRLMEGWEINAITRWQSGRVAQLTSGLVNTVNANDPGIVLIGLTRNQLQSQLGVYKTTPATPPGQVFYFPQSLLNANGTANQSFIAPCKTAGQLCSRIFVTGPRFFRADLSMAKHTKITERVSTEIRAEFLNAFNNINFLYGGNATAANGSRSITSTTTPVGRITDAYQDISTTDDPGGRIIQMVFRINF
jgi:hypothetical protein